MAGASGLWSFPGNCGSLGLGKQVTLWVDDTTVSGSPPTSIGSPGWIYDGHLTPGSNGNSNPPHYNHLSLSDQKWTNPGYVYRGWKAAVATSILQGKCGYKDPGCNSCSAMPSDSAYMSETIVVNYSRTKTDDSLDTGYNGDDLQTSNSNESIKLSLNYVSTVDTGGAHHCTGSVSYSLRSIEVHSVEGSTAAATAISYEDFPDVSIPPWIQQFVGIQIACDGSPIIPDYDGHTWGHTVDLGLVGCTATDSSISLSYNVASSGLVEYHYGSGGTAGYLRRETHDNEVWTVTMALGNKRTLTDCVDEAIGMLSYWPLNRDDLMPWVDPSIWDVSAGNAYNYVVEVGRNATFGAPGLYGLGTYDSVSGNGDASSGMPETKTARWVIDETWPTGTLLGLPLTPGAGVQIKLENAAAIVGATAMGSTHYLTISPALPTGHQYCDHADFFGGASAMSHLTYTRVSDSQLTVYDAASGGNLNVGCSAYFYQPDNGVFDFWRVIWGFSAGSYFPSQFGAWSPPPVPWAATQWQSEELLRKNLPTPGAYVKIDGRWVHVRKHAYIFEANESPVQVITRHDGSDVGCSDVHAPTGGCGCGAWVLCLSPNGETWKRGVTIDPTPGAVLDDLQNPGPVQYVLAATGDCEHTI